MLIACPDCRRQYDVSGMRSGEQVRCRCGKLVRVPGKRPREARILHCSGCGGALRSRALKCDYCGSEISARERNLGPACPECFARLRGEARFCSECGIEIRPEAMKATRVSATCPRCEGELVLQELSEGEYTECSRCGGIWLDSEFFQRLVDERDRAVQAKLLPRKRASSGDLADGEPVRYLPCPTCGEMMHRKNFAGCSGVVIDWCKGHGYWFDTHELEKVIDFVNSGGLERARGKKVEEEKARLESYQRARKRVASSAPYWDSPIPQRGDWISSLGDIWLMVTKWVK